MLVLARKHTSKTAITTSNKVKMTSPPSPDVPISHHLPAGKQTGPCTCGALSLRGQGAPPARPRRWPRRGPVAARAPGAHPGGLAYLAAAPSGAGGLRGAAGRAAGGRDRSGVGPRQLRPLRGRPGWAPITALLPGWGCGVSGPGSGPCLGAKGSDLVSQQSLLVTAIRPEARAARSPGGAGARPGRRWRERLARPGEGGRRPGPAAGRTGVPTRRRGAEEPVLPNTDGKWVTARAALSGGLSQGLGQRLLGLPEIRACGGVSLFLS